VTPTAAADSRPIHSPDAAPAPRLRRLVAFLRRHAGILAVLTVGAALRAVAMLTYWPAFWLPDSTGYFFAARINRPGNLRPYGYSLFVDLFEWTGRVSVVVGIQHLLGLATAFGVYALVVRRGGARWLAALAAAPVALDSFQIVVEHYLLADALFGALLVGGVTALLWRDRLTWPFAALGGACFVAAAVTRTVGVPILALCVLYVLLRWAGWKQVVILVAVIAAPIAFYLNVYHDNYGKYAFGQFQGRFLYARVMAIADCDKLDNLTATERRLCDPRPPKDRPNSNYYIWSKESPATKYAPGPPNDPLLQSFAKKVIAGQPVDYAALVLRETAAYFSPGLASPRGTTCYELWVFPYDIYRPGCEPQPVNNGTYDVRGGQRPEVWDGAAKGLEAYQMHGGYTPGPLLALFLLLALAAIVFRPRRGAWRERLDIALLGSTGLALLVVAVATSQFDYRYGLPAIPLIGAAGALAVTQLRRALVPLPDTPDDSTTVETKKSD
jgi:hypothetical protein